MIPVLPNPETSAQEADEIRLGSIEELIQWGIRHGIRPDPAEREDTSDPLTA